MLELLSIKKSSGKELLKQLEKRTDKIKEYIDRIQVSRDLRKALKSRADQFQKTIKTILKNENKVAPVSSSSSSSVSAFSVRTTAFTEKPFGDPYIRSLVNDPSAAEYVALWRRLSEMKSKSKAQATSSVYSFLEDGRDNLQFMIDDFLAQDEIAFASQLSTLPIDDSNREAVHYLESIIRAQNAEIIAAIRKHL